MGFATVNSRVAKQSKSKAVVSRCARIIIIISYEKGKDRRSSSMYLLLPSTWIRSRNLSGLISTSTRTSMVPSTLGPPNRTRRRRGPAENRPTARRGADPRSHSRGPRGRTGRLDDHVPNRDDFARLRLDDRANLRAFVDRHPRGVHAPGQTHRADRQGHRCAEMLAHVFVGRKTIRVYVPPKLNEGRGAGNSNP